MKRLAFALAVATLALAASTLYLAHALKLERARTAWALIPAASPAANSRATPAPAGATAHAAASDTSIAPKEVERNPTGAPVSPDAARAAAPGQQRLDRPDDPAARAARMADLKAGIGPMMSEGTRYAGLSSYESDRLVDLMAEAMARGQQLGRECQSTAGCDIRALQATQRETGRQDIARLLGADKLRRLDAYEEIQRVKGFRSQLPPGQALTEATANELAMTLAEERYRSVGNAESTSTFNQRMYDRAAKILTAEQLALFKQQQGDAFARD